MRGTLLLIVAVVGRATSANAADELPRSQRDAIVRVDADNAYGTGAFISSNPPIVVTCFHVVQNRSRISIHTNYGDVPVTRIAVDRDADLAYLVSEYLTAAPGLLQLGTPAEGAYRFIGYSSFNSHPSQERTVINTSAKLSTLNGPPPPLKLKRELNVLEFTGDIYPGDSGAPLFTPRGEAVGLAAGMVKMPSAKTRYFAVALPKVRPDFENLTWSEDTSGDDPYQSAVNPYLSTMVFVRDVPWPDTFAFYRDARLCAPALEKQVSAFRGKRSELPVQLTTSSSPTCHRYYDALRRELAKEESNRKATRWIIVNPRVAPKDVRKLLDVEFMKTTDLGKIAPDESTVKIGAILGNPPPSM